MNSNQNKKIRHIWVGENLEKLADVIASLGDRTEDLKTETWRWNKHLQQRNSLWGEVIFQLGLEHTETLRHSLYNLWHLNRHGIRNIVRTKKTSKNNKTTDIDLDQNESSSADDCGASESKNSNLDAQTSLPLPERPRTRIFEEKTKISTKDENSAVDETSFSFTNIEWKNVYSRTHQKMKPDWTDRFYDKLVSIGTVCPLRFTTPHFRRGKRKQRCKYFCCHATCTIRGCSRRFQIILRHQPDENSSVIFTVRTHGSENHDKLVETARRQLIGEKCDALGNIEIF